MSGILMNQTYCERKEENRAPHERGGQDVVVKVLQRQIVGVGSR